MPSQTDHPPLPARLELLVPDMSGVPRGKVIDGSAFDPTHLPRVPAAIFFQTLTGDYVDAMSRYNAADSDVLLEPDWATLAPVPGREDDQAQVVCATLEKSGEPLAYDPRNVLKRVLERYAAAGLAPVVAPEVEFYLLHPGTPVEEPFAPADGRHGLSEHGGEAFSIDALGKYGRFIGAVESASQDAGIDLTGLVHEMGPAQLELNLRHGDALDRTDQLFLLKRIIKNTALERGMLASFLAKPFDALPGSGLHLHVSVYRDGDNVFALEDGSVPAALGHFIGGLQRYLPEAFPLIAPNVNSYKRFVPDLSAPINLEWGYDNRTTGLRVPYDRDEAGRVENRVMGADASPYLAVAATLGCGLLGMEQQIEPSMPLTDDAYEQAADLPRDLNAALEQVRGSQALETLLGAPFLDIYLAVKDHELGHFAKEVTPWERRFLGAEL